MKHSPIQASADAPRGLKPGKFIQPQSQQLPPIRKTSPQEVPEWKAVAMSLESYDLAKSIDGAWKGMTNKDARSRDEEDDLMPAGDEVSDFSRRFAVDSMTSPATATGSFSR